MTENYTTPQNIRDILGLEPEDVTDEILDEFIDKAQRVLLHYVQIAVLDETPTGNVDGSNNTFQTIHPFFADIDFDQSISTLDFTIYGWTDEDDPSTKKALSVSTFYPTYGMIVLSTAPAATTEKITVDYSYYTQSIDWDLVELATRYYAAKMYVAREMFLVPDQLTIGNIKIRQNQPWERLHNEFLRIIYHLTTIPMDIVNYSKLVMSPRKKISYTGPGTTYQAEDLFNSGDNEKDTT